MKGLSIQTTVSPSSFEPQGNEMPDLSFVPVDEPGLHLLQSWFEDDEFEQHYYRPTDTWLEYVCNKPGVHAWIIYEDGVPVGHLQLDTEADGTGYVGLVVKPELRSRGYGKRILRALLDRPEVRWLKRIVGTAEADNVASHRCLQATGFLQQGSEPDEEGFLTFVYNKEAG
jgi:RimJ/RimL family protein N-acetyltransferase